MLLDVRADHLKIVQEILQKFVPDREVWAFGSRAKWLAKEYSDLDLCIVGDSALSFRTLGLLDEAFEDSDLPYKVDVVDWATTGESFRKIIERDRVVVQEVRRGLDMLLKTETLASMCEAVVDCPHSTPVWTESGYVVLRNQNIRDGRLDISSPSFTDEEHFKHRIRRLAPRAGDIVITREAPMGEVCKIPEGLQCCLGQRQVLLRPKAGVNSDYLLYALQSPFVQNQIRWNEGTGSTVSNIRIPVLEKIEIPRHGYTESSIAKILSSIDAKIDLNRRINQTLEGMAQAIFKSWFVDFDPVKAKIAAKADGRDPLRAAMTAISGKPDAELDALPAEQYDPLAATAALFPDEMEVSELGEIPRGWICPGIETLANVKQGKYLGKDEMQEAASAAFPFPVWGGNGILGYSQKFAYSSPVVLMTCRGSNCGLIKHTESAAWVSNNSFACIPKIGSTLFLLTYFQAELFDDCVSGSAQPQITYTSLKTKKLKFPVEPNVCAQFSKLMDSAFSAILSLNKQTSELSALRDTLLPKLLSGELSVTNATAEAAV